MTGIARSHNAMSIPMIRVSLDLLVHAIIVLWLVRLLLLSLLNLWMIVGIKSTVLAVDDADLLIVVF